MWKEVEMQEVEKQEEENGEVVKEEDSREQQQNYHRLQLNIQTQRTMISNEFKNVSANFRHSIKRI